MCRVLIGETPLVPAHQALCSYPRRHHALPPPSPFQYAVHATGFTHAQGQAAAGPSSNLTAQREAARTLLERVLAVMNRFRETSPLMGMLRDGFVSVQGAM